MQPVSTIIVGAGIAGLRCAVALQQAGRSFTQVESSDGAGGRMRTDEVDGFQLDRGFQVLQTAYPELDGVIDMAALELTSLEPGALVWHAGRWARMSDPWRRPQHALSTLFNGVGTLADRWKLMRLRRDALASPDFPEAKTLGPDGNDCQAMDWLGQQYGFSNAFVDLFLRPWWSGVFLEGKLETSAAFMRFVFKMLSSGTIAYPQRGIQAIPDQLANKLPAETMKTADGARTIDLSGKRVTVELESGQRLEGEQLVLAVPMDVASQMLASTSLDPVSKPLMDRAHTHTSCLYFSIPSTPAVATSLPTHEPVLMLCGDRRAGPVNHVFPQSLASGQLAPKGKELVSVNLIGEHCTASEQEVRSHLEVLFGEPAHRWELIKRYDLPHALPAQPAGFRDQRDSYIYEADRRVVCCGDYVGDASLNGALRSGREAAEWVLGGNS